MYLRIKNWEKYQNADLAKKTPGELPWIKLWTKQDYELCEEPYFVRLLFVELLKLAGRHLNAISKNVSQISSDTRMKPQDVAEGLDILLKTGWLSETKTSRRSRVDSRKHSRKILDLEVEVEVEKNPPNPPEGGNQNLSNRDLRRYTGCRYVYNGRAETYVRDPLGTDKPPSSWPHATPSRSEIAAEIQARAA